MHCVYTFSQVRTHTHLIVLRERNDKEDCSDVVETMDPLFPLAPLPANVKHVESQVLELELDLHDASCLEMPPMMRSRCE